MRQQIPVPRSPLPSTNLEPSHFAPPPHPEWMSHHGHRGLEQAVSTPVNEIAFDAPHETSYGTIRRTVSDFAERR